MITEKEITWVQPETLNGTNSDLLYLQYSSAHTIRMVMQEFIWKAQHFSQPVHHIHFQFCTGGTGSLEN